MDINAWMSTIHACNYNIVNKSHIYIHITLRVFVRKLFKPLLCLTWGKRLKIHTTIANLCSMLIHAGMVHLLRVVWPSTNAENSTPIKYRATLEEYIGTPTEYSATPTNSSLFSPTSTEVVILVGRDSIFHNKYFAFGGWRRTLLQKGFDVC